MKNDLTENQGAWAAARTRLFGARKGEAPKPPELDMNRLPRHIAIIMDGNGRWATRRGLPRTAGHRAGVEALRAIIRACDGLKIEALSIYAFSTENWSRSKEEVGALMGLLLAYFRSEIDELDEKNVCIRILGDVDGMPGPQRQALYDAMARTGKNTGLKLNIALNYGGRDELLRAAKILAARAVREGVDPDSFTRADFEDALYTRGLPDVDLLIRTSGEMRISNFLPYQIAYAEFVVVDTLWPDFDVAALRSAIAAYQGRDRRFGGVKESKENQA
ncbi:MAG: isoprenyl transferase [Clostridia bacterium]|nr:isoprenyl transferase [Clostridia bacterium]